MGHDATVQASGHVDGDTGGAGRRQSGRAPNDALFARNAYGGLQTPYGEVKLGRVLNPVFLATAQTDFIPGGADGADGAGSGHARPVAASQLFRRWQLPLRRLERLRCVQRCVGCAAARERQDRPARRVGGGRQRQYPGVVGPHQERQRRRAGQSARYRRLRLQLQRFAPYRVICGVAARPSQHGQSGPHLCARHASSVLTGSSTAMPTSCRLTACRPL
ncbi:hypothetical protein GTP69_27995 [Duganella sp. CY42W]|uniref:Uncharacterized protein n=1 Tax=Duganella levis TaxID=2692169 RepID=A0ABW9W8M3_9BURK|nr:hypothetical protein [Duganella levis]